MTRSLHARRIEAFFPALAARPMVVTMTVLMALAASPPVAWAETPKPMKAASVDELVNKLADPPRTATTRSLRNLQLKPRAVDLSIGFDFDSATIQPGSRELLERLASAMQHERLAEQRFTVEGHTDAKGSAAYNQRLSARRAQAVVAFLAEQGVTASRLEAHGKGFTELLDSTRPFAAENRRVRITALTSPTAAGMAPPAAQAATTGLATTAVAASSQAPGTREAITSSLPASKRGTGTREGRSGLTPSDQLGSPAVLVTEQEALASRSAPPRLEPRSVPMPDAPAIDLLLPDLSSPVTSPTAIQLRFQTAADASIDPASFRVRYGTFRIDITSRIMQAATVTASGIDVPQAALPKGSHRLYIGIQDTRGRETERRVDFTVQ
jgi:outer membrane protein OmpA-like peptidoglycan-associated protein